MPSEQPPLCALHAANGQLMCAEGGGGGPVNANRGRRGPWETFVMSDHSSSAGRLRYNHRYAFRTDDGHFLMAAGGGGGAFLANGTVSARPVFSVRNPAGPVAQGDLRHGIPVGIETPTGHFVCAEGGGGREVVADRGQLLGWELFTLDLLIVGHLRTLSGFALRAEPGAGRPIAARSSSVGPSSIFEVCLLSGWPLEDGDRIALRAHDGRFVRAEGGGGGQLSVGAGTIGTSETFTLAIHDHTTPWSWRISLRAHGGQWVCAEGNGGGEVNATRSVPLAWETFELGRIL